MVPQLPSRVRSARGVAAWVGLVIGRSITAVLAIALGIVFLVVAIAAWVVRGAVWLVLYVWTWLRLGIRRISAVVYPFALRAPVTAVSRSVVLNRFFCGHWSTLFRRAESDRGTGEHALKRVPHGTQHRHARPLGGFGSRSVALVGRAGQLQRSFGTVNLR